MEIASSLPSISIITPSFNQGYYLEQTLVSVLSQGYPGLEYLVVDGGSTDGSLEIIQRYTSRLAWWVSEPDNGQAEAINKGLQRASGELVAWLNSDDYYLPGALRKVAEVFAAHPETGLVFGDVLAVDDQGKALNLLRYGDWGLADLMAFRIIGQPSIFMRHNLLEKAGLLDTSFHYLLDHQLWLRLAQLAGMTYLPETLSAARFHSESKNVSHASEFSQEVYLILDWMKSQPRLAETLKRKRRRIEAGASRLSAYYLLEGGQPGKSLAEYGKSLRLHPATTLRDWRRVGYAFLSLLGLGKMGEALRKRK